MRRELKKRGVESLKVVYSEEIPLSPNEIQALYEGEKTDTDKAVIKSTDMESEESYADSQNRDARRRSIPGSIAFVPSVAGLIIAGEVIKDLAMDN